MYDREQIVNDLGKGRRDQGLSSFIVAGQRSDTHLESEVPRRIVHRRNVHHRLILTLRVIPQEGHNRNHRRRDDVDGEFILVHGELLDVFGETGSEVLTVLMEWCNETGCHFCGIDARWLTEGDG